MPDDGVAVFFAVGPDNGYQLEQWRRPLESLAARRGVFLIVDRADTGRRLASEFDLPIAFARGSAALEVLVERHRVRAVLYVNNVEPNFRMMRFAEPLHIQLGHGESDKGGERLQPAQGVRPHVRRPARPAATGWPGRSTTSTPTSGSG